LALRITDGGHNILLLFWQIFNVSREILKAKINPGLFFVFNIAFISLAQSVLLFLISTPAYVMLLTTRLGDTMDTTDIMISRVLMGLIMVEFFADQQQWGKKLLPNPETSLTCHQITRRQRNLT